MKKIFLILIFFTVSVYTLDIQSTLNIYHEVFSSLLGDRKIKVYTTNKELRKVFRHSKKIILSNSLADSTIALVSTKSDLIFLKEKYNNIFNKVIIFATDYRLLKESDMVVGAFYWKKGRTQLLFIRQRLNRFHINLPAKYKSFIVDKL